MNYKLTRYLFFHDMKAYLRASWHRMTFIKRREIRREDTRNDLLHIQVFWTSYYLNCSNRIWKLSVAIEQILTFVWGAWFKRSTKTEVLASEQTENVLLVCKNKIKQYLIALFKLIVLKNKTELWKFGLWNNFKTI